MNHPVEEAASQASSWSLATLTKIGAGTGFTVGIGTINEWLAMSGGILTVIYGALKIIEWFEDRGRKRQDWRERDEMRASERKTLEGLYRKVGSWRTKPGQLAPAELTPEERYASSPTPLFDETYPPNQDHHEGKRQ